MERWILTELGRFASALPTSTQDQNNIEEQSPQQGSLPDLADKDSTCVRLEKKFGVLDTYPRTIQRKAPRFLPTLEPVYESEEVGGVQIKSLQAL